MTHYNHPATVIFREQTLPYNGTWMICFLPGQAGHVAELIRRAVTTPEVNMRTGTFIIQAHPDWLGSPSFNQIVIFAEDSSYRAENRITLEPLGSGSIDLTKTEPLTELIKLTFPTA